MQSWPAPARVWRELVDGEWTIVRRTEAARRRLLELRRAEAGAPGLSQRQRQIMALAADGLGNAQIAAALRISSSTVSRSIQRALPLLGFASRAELSLLCGRSPAR